MGVADLQQQLADCHSVYLDTMVFIYLLEAHPGYAELASATLKLVEEGVIAGLTSTLTIAELLTAPAQADDDRALRDYELYLTHFPHLTILPLTIADARRAARVRAKTNLRMPDAIQIATAMEAGADVIIGNDKRWRGRTGPLRLLLLDDFLEVESPLGDAHYALSPV